MPPGWDFETSYGYDSMGGRISNGSLQIGFDFSGNYSCGDSPGMHAYQNVDFPELRFWEEEIDSRMFYFHRPVGDDRDDRGRIGSTGACVPRLPYADSDIDYQYGGPGIGIQSYVEPEEDQELVLAILRTLRAVQ